MKIVQANKKTRITLSKKEWKEIGKTAGWLKTAQNDIMPESIMVFCRALDDLKAYASKDALNRLKDVIAKAPSHYDLDSFDFNVTAKLIEEIDELHDRIMKMRRSKKDTVSTIPAQPSEYTKLKREYEKKRGLLDDICDDFCRMVQDNHFEYEQSKIEGLQDSYNPFGDDHGY